MAETAIYAARVTESERNLLRSFTRELACVNLFAQLKIEWLLSFNSLKCVGTTLKYRPPLATRNNLRYGNNKNSVLVNKTKKLGNNKYKTFSFN